MLHLQTGQNRKYHPIRPYTLMKILQMGDELKDDLMALCHVGTVVQLHLERSVTVNRSSDRSPLTSVETFQS